MKFQNYNFYTMKTCIVIFFLVFLFALFGCDKTTVGYLFTDNLSYTPDSLVVKAVLDPGEDLEQIEGEIPWQSIPLEGVQGTAPIKYDIERVQTSDGDPAAVSQFKMVRKGVIELPWNHTVPVGRYVFSIRVSNEGYSIVKDSVYTVIVQ